MALATGNGAHIEFVADYPAWWCPLLGVERGSRWPSELIVCTRADKANRVVCG